MTKIIAIGGKKQSGKGTVASFLSGLTLTSYKAIDEFRVGANGNLLVGKEQIETDPNSISPKIAKIYSFAGSLKEICSDVLGVKSNQLFGTDQQKNSKTHLKWDNMPGIITDPDLWECINGSYQKRVESLGKREAGRLPLTYHEAGYMTGREVLQYVGTNVFRQMFRRSWTFALKNKIEKEKPVFAFIDDMRFDNEIALVKDMGGIAIYLTRELYPEDSHASESGFSSLDKFDFLVNNDDGDLRNLFKETVEKLNSLKALAPV